MSRDILNMAVVNLKPEWGKKEKNLKRMMDYARSASAQGVKLIAFPEMALTGYDNEDDVAKKDKMQVKQAELIPGESTMKMAELSKELGLYIVFGMPERDPEDDGKVYNAAAVVTPEGEILKYRKMHLPGTEADWATRGDKPLLVDTPWGKIGVVICYDTYRFPELTHYLRAKGARLIINCTACCLEAVKPTVVQHSIETYANDYPVFIASANLVGLDLYEHFMGSSSILGPGDVGKIHYYAGYAFEDERGRVPGLFTATIDLSMAEVMGSRPLFYYNPKVSSPDYRPDVYLKLNEDLVNDENWKALVRE